MNRRDVFAAVALQSLIPQMVWIDPISVTVDQVCRAASLLADEMEAQARQVNSDDLFNFVKHGDEKHQVWLKSAIDAFFKGEPRPDEIKVATKTGCSFHEQQQRDADFESRKQAERRIDEEA